MNLKEQVISGVAWSTVARVLQQVGQILFSVLLARLLFPKDYGLIGMVWVFAGFADIFSDFGFRTALIEKRTLEERHLNSIFWLTLVLGSALTAAFIRLSPYIAAFYHEPLLQPLCGMVAFNYFLRSFGVVPRALLQRRMAFGALARVEILTTFLSGSVAVFFAISGWRVWSLVAQILTTGFASSAMVFLVSGWRPRISFQFSAVNELLHYSANLVGFNCINYWARNADDLIIGKMLGASSVGIYNRAYTLMLLPISQVISVISDVMFTALSAIQDNKPQVKGVYLRAMGIITLIAFPMMMGMYVTAAPFILLLYGTQWMEVVPILRILCAVGLLQSLCSPAGWLYTSQGRTDWMFRWGAVGSGTLVAGIFGGALFGTVYSITVGYALANFVIFYPAIAIPGKLIDLKFKEIATIVAPQLSCSAVMATCVWIIGESLPSYWPSWVTLAVDVASGMFIYSTLISFFKISAYRDVCGLIGERWFSTRKANSTVDAPNPA